jgi:hypothetical protein
MTFCRILSLAAVLAATSAYQATDQAHAQFGGMPGMPGFGAPGFGGPPAGPPPACQELITLRDQTQKNAAAIQDANKRHASPADACKLFKAFLATENKMLQGMQQNTAVCGVPAEVIKQVQGGHDHASQIAKQVCEVAANGGARPAGPSLSDALNSTPTVPDATTPTKPGQGAFDTLTGNALTR